MTGVVTFALRCWRLRTLLGCLGWHAFLVSCGGQWQCLWRGRLRCAPIIRVSHCSASLGKFISGCWKGGSDRLLNLRSRRSNVDSILTMEQWTSSLPLQGFWVVMRVCPSSVHVFSGLGKGLQLCRDESQHLQLWSYGSLLENNGLHHLSWEWITEGVHVSLDSRVWAKWTVRWTGRLVRRQQ